MASLRQSTADQIINAACVEERELTLKERLLNEKSRISRTAQAQIRKINSALQELEGTEAEAVVARAREVLDDVR